MCEKGINSILGPTLLRSSGPLTEMKLHKLSFATARGRGGARSLSVTETTLFLSISQDRNKFFFYLLPREFYRNLVVHTTRHHKGQ